jgi:pyridoxamine 5'-phosphate oxidase
MSGHEPRAPYGREVYEPGENLPEILPESPFGLFRHWFEEARAAQRQPNPNAMCVSSLDDQNRISSRIVLCRGIDPDPGHVVFYTNYEGRKGKQLRANPECAATFHWDHVDRQVRLEGRVCLSPAEESDRYFARRRWESQLGAWASDQSEPIASRQAMLDKVAAKMDEFGLDLDSIVHGDEKAPEIPRPPHWGGFRLYPRRVELWCGDTGRIHDRAIWEREIADVGGSFDCGPWRATRLQP